MHTSTTRCRSSNIDIIFAVSRSLFNLLPFVYFFFHTHTLAPHIHTHIQTVVPHIIAQWQHLCATQGDEQHVQLSHHQPQSKWTCSSTAPDPTEGESESNCTAECTTQQQAATATAPTTATTSATTPAAYCRGHLWQCWRRGIHLHARRQWHWFVHDTAATAATL